MARRDPDKYLGRWRETSFDPLDLAFSHESFERLLTAGVDAASPYSHQQIVDWCERLAKESLEGSVSVVNDPNLIIGAQAAEDIVINWELYVTNIYTLDQLKKLDFAKVKLHGEFFKNWLRKLDKLKT